MSDWIRGPRCCRSFEAPIWLHALGSSRFRVSGSSMRPTLAAGDRLLVSRLEFQWRAPRRGEIVVFRDPRLPARQEVKRLVGLPGERIALRDGRLLIGEAIWPEPYLAVECREPAREWLLSDRAYLLLGDNRFDSRDSRDFGPVRRELIIGPAWFRYWPPGRRERLRGPSRPS